MRVRQLLAGFALAAALIRVALGSGDGVAQADPPAPPPLPGQPVLSAPPSEADSLLPALLGPGSPLPELLSPDSPAHDMFGPGSPLPEMFGPGSPLPQMFGLSAQPQPWWGPALESPPSSYPVG